MDKISKNQLAARIFGPVAGLDALFVTYGQLAGVQYSSHMLALLSFLAGIIAFAGVIVVGEKIKEENVENFVVGIIVLLGLSIAIMPLHLDLKWVDGSGVINPPIILIAVFFISLVINMVVADTPQPNLPNEKSPDIYGEKFHSNRQDRQQPIDFNPTDDLTHFELTDDPAVSYDGWIAKQQMDEYDDKL